MNRRFHIRRETGLAIGQQGAATVEFALISIWLVTLVIGMIEVGRVMMTWTAAAESTRLGARRAAVCNVTDAAERDKLQTAMKAVLPLADTSGITATITASPSGCDNATTACLSVTAALSGTITTIVPFVTFNPSLPSFSTTISRESMSSTNNGAVCKSTL